MAFRRFPEGAKPEFNRTAVNVSLAVLMSAGALAVATQEQLEPVRDVTTNTVEFFMRGLAAVGESG